MKNITFTAMLLFVVIATALSQDLKSIVDLRGSWKFQLGDNEKWSELSINDSKWDDIYVPNSWEDEGYPGYDGYAWYRKHCTIPISAKEKVLYLNIGNTDDVSEVYINGHFVGFAGSFPPHYSTAYSESMKYFLLPEYLRYGADNVIAVRIYDRELSGGIVNGEIGIYEKENPLVPEVSLPVRWKFKTGDDREWKEPLYNDKSWGEIDVPAFWETQGYKNYDGIAWYRVRFRVPTKYEKENLVLLLGKIDDVDEAYLNGKRIGKSGSIPSNLLKPINSEYQTSRIYALPKDLLNESGENVLAVRVFDNFMHGGIYDGPVGITTKRKYDQWYHAYGEEEDNTQKSWKGLQNGLEKLLDEIFKK